MRKTKQSARGVKRYGRTDQNQICGLTRLEDIDAVNELKPEYVGFVFAKSRRQITKEHAVTLRRYLDPEIQAVGVFVNELPAIVAGYLEEGVIDLAQLHGNESEEYIHSLRFRTGGELIKAFSIKTREDVEKAKKAAPITSFSTTEKAVPANRSTGH